MTRRRLKCMPCTDPLSFSSLATPYKATICSQTANNSSSISPPSSYSYSRREIVLHSSCVYVNKSLVDSSSPSFSSIFLYICIQQQQQLVKWKHHHHVLERKLISSRPPRTTYLENYIQDRERAWWNGLPIKKVAQPFWPLMDLLLLKLDL